MCPQERKVCMLGGGTKVLSHCLPSWGTRFTGRVLPGLPHGHPHGWAQTLCRLAAQTYQTSCSPTEEADSVCTWGQFPSSPNWVRVSTSLCLSLACANVSGKNRKFRDGGKCLAGALSPEPGHLLCLRAERAGSKAQGPQKCRGKGRRQC